MTQDTNFPQYLADLVCLMNEFIAMHFSFCLEATGLEMLISRGINIIISSGHATRARYVGPSLHLSKTLNFFALKGITRITAPAQVLG